MIFYVMIFLMLSSFGYVVLGRMIGKRNLGLINFLFLFVVIQLLLSPLTGIHLIKYNAYKIISYLITSLYSVGSIVIFIYLIYKNKSSLNFNNFKSSLLISVPLLATWIFAILIMLFTKTIFVDTTAYIGISNFFKTGIYTFGEGDTQLAPLSYTYSYPQEYFFYSLNSNLEIPYYFFNPLKSIVLVTLLFDYFQMIVN